LDNQNKDPVKQRAGRLGTVARWKKDLQFLEKSLQRRKFQLPWRTGLHYGMFAFICLYRSHRKNFRYSKDKLEAWLDAQRMPKRSNLTKSFLTSQSVTLATEPRKHPKTERTLPPYLHIHWSREKIASWLKIPWEEAEEIVREMKPQKKDPPPKSVSKKDPPLHPNRAKKRRDRLITMMIVLNEFQEKLHREPTVREYQKGLRRRGVKASLWTINRERKELPK
jgi:hypothetical protein